MPDEANTSQNYLLKVYKKAWAPWVWVANQGSERRHGIYGRTFKRATRWIAVNDTDKLDLLLLVGREELQKLLQTMPEQPTDYKSHIEMLDQHFKANRNNTLRL